MPRTFGRRTFRPCGFPLYRPDHRGVARSGGRFGVSPAIPHSAASLATRLNEQNRIDSSSRRLRSVARVRSVKPTRLMLPARSRRTRRSSFCLRRLGLAARMGHSPTRPLRAAFRYPLPGAIARPCRTSGPSLFVPRPAALLGFIPFAGLIPLTGGHTAQMRRLNIVSDISVRPGPPAVRADSSASRLIFVGMTGRRLGTRVS